VGQSLRSVVSLHRVGSPAWLFPSEWHGIFLLVFGLSRLHPGMCRVPFADSRPSLWLCRVIGECGSSGSVLIVISRFDGNFQSCYRNFLLPWCYHCPPPSGKFWAVPGASTMIICTSWPSSNMWRNRLTNPLEASMTWSSRITSSVIFSTNTLMHMSRVTFRLPRSLLRTLQHLSGGRGVMWDTLVLKFSINYHLK
jgi:hypothetical protein